ncbi:CHAT domain-containing protein [Oricola sp.]|uniref:CHAT domain-containing protein n=1 Tax=Oricola sp. TaxID=1979950 RepID=UPI003513C8BB
MKTTLASAIALLAIALADPAPAQETEGKAPIDQTLLKSAESGDPSALYDLGWAYLERKEVEAASTTFLKAADAFEVSTGEDSLKWKAESFSALGYAHMQQGADGYNQAADYYRRAVETYGLTDGEDMGGLKPALYNLGWIYRAKGGAENLESARKYLRMALDLYANAEGDNLKWKGAVFSMLGDAHLDSAHFTDAMTSYDSAMSIYAQIGNMPALAASLESKGMALQGLSKYEAAIALFGQARQIRIREFGDTSREVADTWLDEGISLEGLHRYDEALDAYTEALLRYTKALGPDAAEIGWATNNIGWVHRRLENYEVSKRWFLKAEPIIVRHEGRYSRNAGKVAINIGIIEHYLGNQDSAIRWTMKSMPYIKANHEITLEEQRWAFDTFARAFRAKGDPKRAIAFAKLAVNAQQSIRSANKSLSEGESKELKDEWRWLYQHLADMLIEQGRFTEAQAVLNMEKEQEVFEFLRRDASADLRDTRALLNDAEQDEEVKIAALSEFPLAAARELDQLIGKIERDEATDEDIEKIDVLQASIDRAAENFDQQVDAFLADVEEDRKQSFESQFDAVGSQQAILEEFEQKTAILQVAAIDKATHIFVTLPSVTLHKQSDVSKVELSRMTFDALVAIEARSADTTEKLKALYDVVVRPVAQDLKEAGVEVVMLNLDGFLRYLPFAALYDGEHYFVEDYAVALYTPSVPTQFRRGDRLAAKSAGFGVTAAHPGFSPLPGVKREIEQIFAGEDNNGILEGPAEFDDAFSEKSLRLTLLKKPEILHIASHFNLMPGQIDNSFLLLGDGAHLPLSDIRNKRALSFKGIDLVTLSACQTAMGGGGDGSEIEGFGTTAQMSGASAVMASLWPVADEATAKLMEDFYDNMMRGGMSKADALRAAQITMMRGSETLAASEGGERAAMSKQKRKADASTGFSHPYFWSSFILIGNWL